METSEPKREQGEPEDIWKDYDPRKSMSPWPSTRVVGPILTVDELIANIYRAREAC